MADRLRRDLEPGPKPHDGPPRYVRCQNAGTATGIWIYSGQLPGEMVSVAKRGSWYLLLHVDFVTVTLVIRRALHRDALEFGAGAETLAKS
jgi:hypothetical protein